MVLIETKAGEGSPSVAKSYSSEGGKSCLPSDTSGLAVSGFLFCLFHRHLEASIVLLLATPITLSPLSYCDSRLLCTAVLLVKTIFCPRLTDNITKCFAFIY